MQIVLSAMATPSNVNDINMPVAMLAEIKRRGFEFTGRLFHADRGHDAEYNYWMIFWMGMIPPPTSNSEEAPPTGPRPTEGRRPRCSTRTGTG